MAGHSDRCRAAGGIAAVAPTEWPEGCPRAHGIGDHAASACSTRTSIERAGALPRGRLGPVRCSGRSVRAVGEWVTTGAGGAGRRHCVSSMVAVIAITLKHTTAIARRRRLWWAASALSEHRGDGHVAAPPTAVISPCEALVLAAAAGLGRQPRRGRPSLRPRSISHTINAAPATANSSPPGRPNSNAPTSPPRSEPRSRRPASCRCSSGWGQG